MYMLGYNFKLKFIDIFYFMVQLAKYVPHIQIGAYMSCQSL